MPPVPVLGLSPDRALTPRHMSTAGARDMELCRACRDTPSGVRVTLRNASCTRRNASSFWPPRYPSGSFLLRETRREYIYILYYVYLYIGTCVYILQYTIHACEVCILCSLGASGSSTSGTYKRQGKISLYCRQLTSVRQKAARSHQ